MNSSSPTQIPFVPTAAMEDHVASGVARPLLEVSQGPVRFGGAWWTIPREEPDRYIPVEDPRVITVLDDAERRIAANTGQDAPAPG